MGGILAKATRKRPHKGEAIRSTDSVIAAAGNEGEQFSSLYKLGKKLGEGTYATVYRCTHKPTGQKRAVKVVHVERFRHSDDMRCLEEEISILSTLQHENIVRLHHVFRAPSKVYLVQELCSGGELFDRIVKKKNYCENDARELMRRALEALAYAHGKGVVHRDLKPENVLLSRPDDDVELKLADFGLGRFIQDEDPLSTVCGSPGYMAPEVIRQEPYDEKVDIWAFGTICFCLLGGYNPWDDRSAALVFARIGRGAFDFESPTFKDVTEDAKDLIRHMLVTSPQKRISAQAALQHRWFHLHDSMLQHQLSLSQERLMEYRKITRFRVAVNTIRAVNRLKRFSCPTRGLGRFPSTFGGSNEGGSGQGSFDGGAARSGKREGRPLKRQSDAHKPQPY